MEAKVRTKNKTFTDRVVDSLAKSGYKVFSNLPIVEGNLPFIAVAQEEILILGEVLPIGFSRTDIGKAILKLHATHTAITNIFIDTLDNIEIKISMVIVCEEKVKLSNKMQSMLSYSNIKLLSFNKNKKSFLKSFHNTNNLNLLEEEDFKEDFTAYVEYIETVLSYLTSSPVKLMGNTFDSAFSNIFDDDENVENQFDEKSKITVSENLQHFNSARKLAEEVKKYVKGQDEVIEKVAVPFFQHIQSKTKGTSSKIKNSFLLIGNTGVGKSEILRQFAKIVDVPVIRINLPNCTPEGWKGNNISNEISSHIHNEKDIERLRYAIIIFNEFDKIAQRTETETSDFRAELQKQLLQFFDEDYKLSVRINSNDLNKMFKNYELPVNDFLICFDGAFKGIENCVEKRFRSEGKISFGKIGYQATGKTVCKIKDCSYDSLMENITKQDLEKYGIMSEMCGRIEQIILMNQMTEELIYEIITEADESIVEQHRRQCEELGFKMSVTEEAFRKIAAMVQETGLGIRAVKSIFNNLMEKIYFDHEPYIGNTLTIDTEYIEMSLFRDSNRKLIRDYQKMQNKIINKEQLLLRNDLSEEELLAKMYFLGKLK